MFPCRRNINFCLIRTLNRQKLHCFSSLYQQNITFCWIQHRNQHLVLCSTFSGTFSMLKLTFHIRRKKFYYVVSIYIPTILITILSWVSFWIPRSSPPARVALGITTVLALTTLIFGIQSSMPRVSYVKAIDWFLCVSFLYVFAALVEYPSSTFVKSQAKKLSRKGTNILRKVKGLKEDSEDSFPLSGTRYGSTDKSKVGTGCNQ